MSIILQMDNPEFEQYKGFISPDVFFQTTFCFVNPGHYCLDGND